MVKTDKAKFRFWQGNWWCRLQGLNGTGKTMDAAWEDLWTQYAQAIRPPGSWYQGYPRA